MVCSPFDRDERSAQDMCSLQTLAGTDAENIHAFDGLRLDGLPKTISGGSLGELSRGDHESMKRVHQA